MKIVQSANKQLTIGDDKLETYLAAGYVQIDETTGKPIAVPKPENAELTAAKAAAAQLAAEVEQLTAQVTELDETKAQVKKLSAQLQAAKKKAAEEKKPQE